MSHGYEHIDRIVGLLIDGRTIAKGIDHDRPVLAGGIQIDVTVPNLRYIEEVINIQLTTVPQTNIGNYPQKTSIVGNVVGVTITGIAAGTTLTTEIIAIGV